ncbi:MAG: 30S ribosomal protein S9, partial [Bradymonadaceae bacterium]
MPSEEQFHAIGRRKEASARVFLSPGDGDVTVNEQDVDEYFDRRSVVARARKALEFADMEGEVDILATVQGGGKAGQADALQLGVARALTLFDPDLR